MGDLAVPFGVVYRLTNIVTGAAYIGITRQSPEKRFLGHLKASKREDSVLYRALRKYGRAAFRLETLATASSASDLNALEAALISEHATHVRFGGYNMTGGGEGSPDICEITRERMRAAAKRRMDDPRIKAKIAASLTGRKIDPAVVARVAASHRGKPLSDAHRKTLSERAKGKEISLEQREKISRKLRGRKLPPEHVEAAAAALRGKKRSPQAIANAKAGLARPEVRARRSQLMKRVWANSPERRAATAARNRARMAVPGARSLADMRWHGVRHVE